MWQLIGEAIVAGARTWLPRAGRVAQGVSAFSEFASSFPQLEDEVTVEVKGQPGSTKQNLYWLALSLASGMVRRYDTAGVALFTPMPAGMVMIEYDAADSWVRCTLRYKTNMAVVSLSLTDRAGAPGAPGTIEVYNGPPETFNGAPFNFTNFVLPGFLTPATAKQVVPLPWAGRTILTTAPTCVNPDPTINPPGTAAVINTPNPKPPGDNRSRGAIRPTVSMTGQVTSQFLIPLIFASLSTPGSAGNMLYAPPVGGPLGG